MLQELRLTEAAERRLCVMGIASPGHMESATVVHSPRSTDVRSARSSASRCGMRRSRLATDGDADTTRRTKPSGHDDDSCEASLRQNSAAASVHAPRTLHQWDSAVARAKDGRSPVTPQDTVSPARVWVDHSGRHRAAPRPDFNGRSTTHRQPSVSGRTEDSTLSLAVPRPGGRLPTSLRESKDGQVGIRAGLLERMGARCLREAPD